MKKGYFGGSLKIQRETLEWRELRMRRKFRPRILLCRDGDFDFSLGD